jgi:hypothetical protein
MWLIVLMAAAVMILFSRTDHVIEFSGSESYVWWQSYAEPAMKYRIPLDRYLEIAQGLPRGDEPPAKRKDLVGFLTRCCEEAELLPMTPADLEAISMRWRTDTVAAAAAG